MSNNLYKLLSADDKLIGESRDELTRLFRQVLYDLKINTMRGRALLERYLSNPKVSIPNTTRARSNARGNLNKELPRDFMTWKIFKRGLSFLAPKSAKLEILLHWRIRRTTVHVLDIPLYEPYRRKEGPDIRNLFGRILFEVNVSVERWDELMKAYLDNPRNGIPNNMRDRSTARGNLNKELLNRDRMTWKAFSKGLTFLNPRKITYRLILEWDDGKTTTHVLDIEVLSS